MSDRLTNTVASAPAGVDISQEAIDAMAETMADAAETPGCALARYVYDDVADKLLALRARVTELERQLEDEKWECKQHRNAAKEMHERERRRLAGTWAYPLSIIQDDCPENATLVTNICTERLSLDWLDYNRFDVMREAVRLYGKHFGLRLTEQAFARNGQPMSNSLALHRTGPRCDLSTFWRLHEAIGMECAKA